MRDIAKTKRIETPGDATAFELERLLLAKLMADAQAGSIDLRKVTEATATLGGGLASVVANTGRLVLPRVIAAVIAFPFLVFFGDLMGVIGGGIAAWLRLGISPQLFIERFANVVELDMFAFGMIKAPVLAATVALIGCYQGLAVRGGPDELGRQTTRAVVQAIFMVLLLDALFSVFLGVVGI